MDPVVIPAFIFALGLIVFIHELGHYLGLAHTEDTSNTMHENPSLASARGFDAEQIARMLRHPYVFGGR